MFLSLRNTTPNIKGKKTMTIHDFIAELETLLVKAKEAVGFIAPVVEALDPAAAPIIAGIEAAEAAVETVVSPVESVGAPVATPVL